MLRNLRLASRSGLRFGSHGKFRHVAEYDDLTALVVAHRQRPDDPNHRRLALDMKSNQVRVS